jgi:hypothetical protein
MKSSGSRYVDWWKIPDDVFENEICEQAFNKVLDKNRDDIIKEFHEFTIDFVSKW